MGWREIVESILDYAVSSNRQIAFKAKGYVRKTDDETVERMAQSAQYDCVRQAAEQELERRRK